MKDDARPDEGVGAELLVFWGGAARVERDGLAARMCRLMLGEREGMAALAARIDGLDRAGIADIHPAVFDAWRADRLRSLQKPQGAGARTADYRQLNAWLDGSAHECLNEVFRSTQAFYRAHRTAIDRENPKLNPSNAAHLSPKKLMAAACRHDGKLTQRLAYQLNKASYGRVLRVTSALALLSAIGLSVWFPFALVLPLAMASSYLLAVVAMAFWGNHRPFAGGPIQAEIERNHRITRIGKTEGLAPALAQEVLADVPRSLPRTVPSLLGKAASLLGMGGAGLLGPIAFFANSVVCPLTASWMPAASDNVRGRRGLRCAPFGIRVGADGAITHHAEDTHQSLGQLLMQKKAGHARIAQYFRSAEFDREVAKESSTGRRFTRAKWGECVFGANLLGILAGIAVVALAVLGVINPWLAFGLDLGIGYLTSQQNVLTRSEVRAQIPGLRDRPSQALPKSAVPAPGAAKTQWMDVMSSAAASVAASRARTWSLPPPAASTPRTAAAMSL